MSEPLEDLNDDVRYPARRKAVIFLIVSFSLFALIFVVVEIENWRGRSAWNKYQREAEAKGETFDILKLAPPIVPNESNFASVPMFAKLFDYYRDSSGKTVWRNPNAKDENPFRIEGIDSAINSPSLGYWVAGRKIDLSEWQTYYQKISLETGNGRTLDNVANEFPIPDQLGKPANDVLLTLSKFEGAINELREASARPYSQFPIRYQDHMYTLLPHLAKLKSAATLLHLRASAQLEAGQIRRGADDVILNLRVANSPRDEPLLISQLVRMAMVTICLYPMWEGLREEQWTDIQLGAFQRVPYVAIWPPPNLLWTFYAPSEVNSAFGANQVRVHSRNRSTEQYGLLHTT